MSDSHDTRVGEKPKPSAGDSGVDGEAYAKELGYACVPKMVARIEQ